jgi:hypothetical protein
MKPTVQSPTGVVDPTRNTGTLLVFLFAGLRIAFCGICARPDRSFIDWRVLRATAEFASAIESL